MKFNKWTLGLAAVGVVSLASAVQGQDTANTANTVLTGLSSTTLSGYVDTSAQWNPGTGNQFSPPYKFGGASKADGFNLDVVQLTLAKPMDESEWASGYHVDLWFGPDANTLGTQSVFGSGGSGYHASQGDFAIRQAYVALRTPVGNGIDWKIGVFDSIIGYESVASPSDPNYSRSYGHSIEPQTETGLLGTYRINDNVSFSLGIADTIGPTINDRAFKPIQTTDAKAESYKTYMGSVALTAPDNWGFLSGSTLYAGVVNGFDSSYSGNLSSWYVGTTVATPVTGLRAGASFDYLNINNADQVTPGNAGDAWAIALYTSYQATEKLSLHLRGEYLDDRAYFFSPLQTYKVIELTATAQYDLWKNVISRLEFRWDHAAGGKDLFGGNTSFGAPNRKNATMLAANIIYKF